MEKYFLINEKVNTKLFLDHIDHDKWINYKSLDEKERQARHFFPSTDQINKGLHHIRLPITPSGQTNPKGEIAYNSGLQDRSTHAEYAKGYYGISLMQNKNSLSPELDSLSAQNSPFNDDNDSKSTNIIREDIPEVFKDFLSRFTVPISKARLAKLTTKGYLPPHIDIGYENITRIHWPLQTNEKSYWYWYENNKKSETLKLKTGQGYVMNTNIMHSVQNKDTIDRIHLIVNVNMSYDKLRSSKCQLLKI